jgi:peptidoglycan/LPS O-acetylase OafA/YrhL
MRIRELDGLRAIAALAVVAHHYFLPIKYSGAQYGWLGVDIFFVLSGFLITSILLELKSKPDYFQTFYARRAFRIFPPYFVVLAIYLIYSLAIHRAGTVGLWTKYLFYYASLIISTNAEYNLPSFTRFGLNVLWSLSVEELFYTFWAPAVRFIDRKLFWLLPAAMIVAAPIIRAALVPYGQDATLTFYYRMDGLAFGALVAILAHGRRTNAATTATATAHDHIFDRACLVFGVLFAFVAFYAVAAAHPRHYPFTVFGITAANAFFASLVYYVVRHTGESAVILRIFRLRPLRSIGMVSYSLYLVHYPMLAVSQSICSHFHLSQWLNTAAEDVLGLTLTFLAAYAMWYGVEAGALRLKDRLFPSPVAPRTSTHPVAV